MNPNNPDDRNQIEKADPYDQILFEGYTDKEIAEIKTLMETWDKADLYYLSQ
jgi:hypothetical protein